MTHLKSSYSRFKSTETDDDWHTRAASLLLLPFEKNWILHVGRIRKLQFIPLQDGRWTAITDGPVFLPHIDGMLIPTDLGLRIADSNAIKNTRRKKLFVKVGVTPTSVDEVRSLILCRYYNPWISIDVERSVKHLHYLYWTHRSEVKTDRPLRPRDQTSFFVFDHREKRIYKDEDLYFETDEEHDFRQLVGSSLESNQSLGSFIKS